MAEASVEEPWVLEGLLALKKVKEVAAQVMAGVRAAAGGAAGRPTAQ